MLRLSIVFIVYISEYSPLHVVSHFDTKLFVVTFDNDLAVS